MNYIVEPETHDIYEIHIEGHLHQCWAEWFDGLSMSHLENGETVLSGLVSDQAALHGILARLRDLNLKLISVKKI